MERKEKEGVGAGNRGEEEEYMKWRKMEEGRGEKGRTGQGRKGKGSRRTEGFPSQCA